MLMMDTTNPLMLVPEDQQNTDIPDDALCIVGCGAAKQDSAAPAEELYTSTYFALKRRYAKTCDEWRVLSAEFGIVHPRTEIPTYDTHISDLPPEAKNPNTPGTFAHGVSEDLNEWVEETDADTLVLLVGQDYIEALYPVYHNLDVTIRLPFQEAGLGGIGDQMSWLSDHAETRE